MSDALPNASIISKITKLLALADAKSGATEAEALSAASKVQELLQQYGLDMAEIEASGGRTTDDGKREKTTVKRSSMYKWQRELMETIAKGNFCLHRIHEERDEKSGRKVKRHQLIGRSVNVLATQLMYDYLVTTMRKLVSEAGHAPGTHNERDYHFWLEGCSERLRERIQDKAEQAQKESERKAREAKAAASHPASAGPTGTALVLAEVYTNEEELNEDMLCGYEPGTTTRRRLEAEAKTKARDDKYSELCNGGMDSDVAWYIACGYTEERARELVKYWADLAAKDAAEEAKKPNRKSRPNSGPRYTWTKADQREEDKKNSASYRAGQQSAEEIGLDKQITEEEKQRRLGQ